MAAVHAISVVLCTYNGAPYLREQLDSLARESSLPDELIVSDDASSDGTVRIVSEFAAIAPFPVRLSVNATNLGFIANFEKAISLATGDVIALCDQDDVWTAEKLAIMRKAFGANPNLGLLFSDGDIVDDALAPLGRRLFEYASFDRRRQARMRSGDAFDVLLDANVVTGATMAFRADLRKLVLPIPPDPGSSADPENAAQGRRRFHDSWIALLASAVCDVDYIAEPLIQYRQHSAQVTGVREHRRPMILDRSLYREHVAYLEIVDGRLADWSRQNEEWTGLDADAVGRSRLTKPADSRRRLAARIGHVRARAEMSSSRLLRLPAIACELLSGRYARYSSGVRSVLRDILVR
jgi:glycosyltransferase involved in cell wall biosynthesis